MHALIIGLPGAGKSYLVKKMCERGFNAFDVDYAQCKSGSGNHYLAKMIDATGKQVTYNGSAENGWWSNHYYVYDLENLKHLLKENEELFLFSSVGGQPGKGNGDLDIVPMFDKVFYLKVPMELIEQRLANRKGNNLFGKNEGELRIVKEWKPGLDKIAEERGFNIIDATESTDIIIEKITK